MSINGGALTKVALGTASTGLFVAAAGVGPAGFGDVRTLVRRVVASGRAWVAPTLFEGRDVVRICATNGETGTKDVNALIAALNDGT